MSADVRFSPPSSHWDTILTPSNIPTHYRRVQLPAACLQSANSRWNKLGQLLVSHNALDLTIWHVCVEICGLDLSNTCYPGLLCSASSTIVVSKPVCLLVYCIARKPWNNLRNSIYPQDFPGKANWANWAPGLNINNDTLRKTSFHRVVPPFIWKTHISGLTPPGINTVVLTSLQAWLPWVPIFKVTSSGRYKISIQGNVWPWLIPQINSFATSCLKPTIWGHLKFRHPKQLCWQCITTNKASSSPNITAWCVPFWELHHEYLYVWI